MALISALVLAICAHFSAAQTFVPPTPHMNGSTKEFTLEPIDGAPIQKDKYQVGNLLCFPDQIDQFPVEEANYELDMMARRNCTSMNDPLTFRHCWEGRCIPLEHKESVRKSMMEYCHHNCGAQELASTIKGVFENIQTGLIAYWKLDADYNTRDFAGAFDYCRWANERADGPKGVSYEKKSGRVGASPKYNVPLILASHCMTRILTNGIDGIEHKNNKHLTFAFYFYADHQSGSKCPNPWTAEHWKSRIYSTYEEQQQADHGFSWPIIFGMRLQGVGLGVGWCQTTNGSVILRPTTDFNKIRTTAGVKTVEIGTVGQWNFVGMQLEINHNKKAATIKILNGNGADLVTWTYAVYQDNPLADKPVFDYDSWVLTIGKLRPLDQMSCLAVFNKQLDKEELLQWKKYCDKEEGSDATPKHLVTEEIWSRRTSPETVDEETHRVETQPIERAETATTSTTKQGSDETGSTSKSTPRNRNETTTTSTTTTTRRSGDATPRSVAKALVASTSLIVAALMLENY